jgi:hypothetical protein
MRRSLLAGVALLAISACAPQPASAPTGGPPSQVQPLSYAAGSSANTTQAFDGTYTGLAIQNISKGNTLPVAGGSAILKCPDYGVPPTLTITNGLAQFEVLNLTFQGYVTPQGKLSMRSGFGQTFVGQIDNRYVLSGQVLGSCAYTGSWQRSG